VLGKNKGQDLNFQHP